MRLLRASSYANVTSTLALVVALGGTGAYAAAQIGSAGIANNSIQSVDVKNGTLVGGDVRASSLGTREVRNGSLTAADFRAGALALGAVGRNAPRGLLQRGTFSVGSTASGSGIQFRTGETFPVPLSTSVAAHYIKTGDPVPTGCGGTPAAPSAQPGHLCVFESFILTVNGSRGIFNPINDSVDGTAPRFGFAVYTTSSGSGTFVAEGTWAVRAP